jgi:RNA polymerase sigma-70 factor (ECF subfamily)
MKSPIPNPSLETRSACDPDVIARARAGDACATSQILADLQPDLVAAACGCTRRRRGDADVLDLVQEANLALLVAIPTRYDPSRAGVPTYARKIVEKSWLAGLTADARRRRILGRAAPFLPARTLADGIGDTELRHLAAAVERLSKRQREAFVAVELQGEELPELAARLGDAYDAVNSRLGHGRRKLRDALSEALCGRAACHAGTADA